MKAKDTVMKVPDIPIGMEERIYPFTPEELRKELLIQAEISFKAGVREVVEWVRGYWVKHYETMPPKREPIREITIQVEADEWQAKLKEWGIE